MAAKVPFRGRLTCSCVARSLPVVENYMLMLGLINESIDIFQAGYSGAAASKGTHTLGGCVDVGQHSPAQIDAWRLCGWTMQIRHLTGVKVHGHGWPLGCPHLSSSAEAQARDWARGDSGLVGSAGIQGRYPIDNWETALKKREKELTAFADEIVAKTTKAVLAAVAEKVWATDGLIKNVGFTGNEANKTLAPRTALEETFREVAEVRARVAANDTSTDAQLAAIAAKLDQLLTPPAPPVP